MDLGAQLRSPESPERFRWRLRLPAGARLQLSTTAPGAEIIAAGGTKLAHITAPVARRDADDQEVKTTLAVDHDELVVDVAHREADVRYPVMLDPTILEDSAHWYANAAVPVDLSGWMWTDPGQHFGYFYGAAYLGNGLYTYNRGSTAFNAGDYANWYFNAPGTSRIVRAEFGYVSTSRRPRGTWAAPYNDDRTYQGVWSYQDGRYETRQLVRRRRERRLRRVAVQHLRRAALHDQDALRPRGHAQRAAIFGTSVVLRRRARVHELPRRRARLDRGRRTPRR